MPSQWRIKTIHNYANIFLVFYSSILLSFYFHEVLQQLTTLIYTNLRFERVLHFAIEDAWISKVLRDAAFSWRPGKLFCGLKTLPIFLRFCYLNNTCLRKTIISILMSFSSDHAFVGNSNTDVSVDFQRPYLYPSKGRQHGVSIQGFVNLGKTFSRISRIRNMAQTWFLARVLMYLSSFISRLLDFQYWMICIFIFDSVEVETENIRLAAPYLLVSTNSRVY